MWAHERDFDPELLATGADADEVARLKAIIGIESSFNALARHVDADGGASYGLTQLRLETAQALGFSGDSSRLYTPSVHLPYALRLLREVNSQVGPDFGRVLSAWNCGVTHGPQGYHSRCERSDGSYTNADYVARGLRAYSYFAGVPEPVGESGFIDMSDIPAWVWPTVAALIVLLFVVLM